MRGKRVCRLHGGKGGGPPGERNGAYRTGCNTAEANAGRQETRVILVTTVRTLWLARVCRTRQVGRRGIA